MRIAFLDHVFHRKTGSSAFFRDLLGEESVVDDWWIGVDAAGTAADIARILQGDYDRIIVWQVTRAAHRLAESVPEKTVFVPMWDEAVHLTDGDWARLSGIRTVSFCHAGHRRARENGVSSLYVRYYPDPEAFAVVTDFTTRRAFLWQRSGAVTWRDVTNRF